MAPSQGRAGVRRDALRTQLWPLPTISVVLAVGLGIGLPRLDAGLGEKVPASVRGWLFGGGADAARTVLYAIASSLITVTSLTFSLTVVTLQLASSQFSPRLLRTFSSDRFVHVTLALFLATFTYTLTVLRAVRTDAGDQDAFVPQISVSVALILAFASVLGLVFFLAHLAREIRVETMLRNVHAETAQTMHRLLDERDDGTDHGSVPEPPPDALHLATASSGFLVGTDGAALREAAEEADAIVLIDRFPGSSVVAGTPVGFAWPREQGSFNSETRQRLCEQVSAAVTTGAERTADYDIAFGFRQTTDVAIKALSPGINDPTTAVHALSHSAALLCEAAGRVLGPQVLRDDDGRISVVLRHPDLADLLALAVDEPRRNGAAHPAVLARIGLLLRELGWCVAAREHRQAVAEQLDRLRHTIDAQDLDRTEREHLARICSSVEASLEGRWARSDEESA